MTRARGVGGGATLGTELRFVRRPDGAVTAGPTGSNSWFRRHYAELGRLTVVARVQAGDDPRGEPVEGPMVELVALPPWRSPLSFLRWLLPTLHRVYRSMDESAIVVGFLPGIVGSIAMSIGLVRRRLVVAEVVGDPDAVFGVAGVGGRGRRLYRTGFVVVTRWLVRRADAVNYVSLSSLQPRYPASRTALVTSYSNTDIPDEVFERDTRWGDRPRSSFQVITVGSLEQPYKGVDILLRAVAAARSEGAPVECLIVGDGRLRNDLEALAIDLGLADAATFHGSVADRDQLFAHLFEADCFVLASTTEGLPRALIEAMACGLPAVGTRVGGIPDLLPEACLVDPGDVPALSDQLQALWASPAQCEALGRANRERARAFSREHMERVRVGFLRDLVARAGA